MIDIWQRYLLDDFQMRLPCLDCAYGLTKLSKIGIQRFVKIDPMPTVQERSINERKEDATYFYKRGNDKQAKSMSRITTDRDKCFVKDSSVVLRKIADETILVPIRKKAADVESIYVLNEVAGRIWELVDGEKHVQEIRDIIVKEFDVSSEEAEADLAEYLEQLEAAGAVREV